MPCVGSTQAADDRQAPSYSTLNVHDTETVLWHTGCKQAYREMRYMIVSRLTDLLCNCNVRWNH